MGNTKWSQVTFNISFKSFKCSQIFEILSLSSLRLLVNERPRNVSSITAGWLLNIKCQQRATMKNQLLQSLIHGLKCHCNACSFLYYQAEQKVKFRFNESRSIIIYAKIIQHLIQSVQRVDRVLLQIAQIQMTEVDFFP